MALILWQRRAVVLSSAALLGGLLLARAFVLRAHPHNRGASDFIRFLIEPFGDANLASFLFVFLVGVCFALYADQVLMEDRVGVACAVALLLLLRWHGPFDVVGVPAMAYLIFWLGLRLPMHWWDRIGDTSYGVYVYGWPIEVLLAEYGVYQHLGMHLYLIVSILAATAAGWLSWHCLEKQAMKLKGFDPYRLLRVRLATRRQAA